ncbi:hypothetical protein [Shewanella ulleungensis]|uniref:hypothetical protein n=1 Tax=Shewanella ulleungensis TaxID=2282699 RepID=UPI003D799266
MKKLNKKLLTISMVASLLVGCASTDPYKAKSDDDFTYNPDMSFAMNVVDGSLGFHNGLRDADAPKNADMTPGALDYAADGIIGAAFGGGFGGAFLSMLGTNQGNKPLHSYYGIVYFPVSQKGNVQSIYDNVESELIRVAISTRKLEFVKKEDDANNHVKLTFKGEDCTKHQSLMGYKLDETCSFIHYTKPQLLKYSTTTPTGKNGLYAVIGYETFFTATFLALDLDEKYYFFSPVIRNRTKFPFISNKGKIYPFVKGDVSLTIPELMKIDPWVNSNYGLSQ